MAASVLQAAGYVLWIVLPGFPAFAAGFVLWGLGGALVSGAQEALLYDGLVAAAAQEHYARVQGWVTAVGLVAQLPAAAVLGGWRGGPGGSGLAGGHRRAAPLARYAGAGGPEVTRLPNQATVGAPWRAQAFLQGGSVSNLEVIHSQT